MHLRLSNHFAICVCLITARLLIDYVRNSLPISPNFVCGSEMWSDRHLLFVKQTGSSYLISEMCEFPILAVFRLWLPRFLTDRCKNQNKVEINERWLCTWWPSKLEIKLYVQIQISSICEGLHTWFCTCFHKKFVCGSEMWSAQHLSFQR